MAFWLTIHSGLIDVYKRQGLVTQICLIVKIVWLVFAFGFHRTEQVRGGFVAHAVEPVSYTHLGDTVVVLEAMKMQNNIEAEKDGKVTSICVKPGQAVL